ncbi:hypothetical protein [Mammaliicoccus sciuri]|uniref:hypothetical protein n=1 Tax=Mammaliicoccus sciuri TaxID=1296 RepID=UPI0021D2106E|nr:hypothetical protein [Mammaliicoccus sciuri]UXU70143.1 hypothetical protein MUA36_05540 [Mammaliicoccus sciuri]
MNIIKRIKDRKLLKSIKNNVERFDNLNDFLNKYKIDKDDYETYLYYGEIKESGTIHNDYDILESLKHDIEVDGNIVKEILDLNETISNDELLEKFIEKNKYFHQFTIGNELFYSDCCHEIINYYEKY